MGFEWSSIWGGRKANGRLKRPGKGIGGRMSIAVHGTYTGTPPVYRCSGVMDRLGTDKSTERHQTSLVFEQIELREDVPSDFYEHYATVRPDGDRYGFPTEIVLARQHRTTTADAFVHKMHGTIFTYRALLAREYGDHVAERFMDGIMMLRWDQTARPSGVLEILWRDARDAQAFASLLRPLHQYASTAMRLRHLAAASKVTKEEARRG